MGAGIDYGLGKTNIDLKTGIRFGVISQNEVLQTWADSSEAIYEYYCPNCGAYLKKGADAIRCNACRRRLEEGDFDFLEPQGFVFKGEGYYCQQGSDDFDIFILKSPFYTLCRYCSPCAPGAGYLMSPDSDGIKAYCFGPDWFEDVETDNWIDCSRCKGTGYVRKDTIPNYQGREDHFVNHGDDKVLCWVCQHNHETGQIGKVKEYKSSIPYDVYSVKTGKVVHHGTQNS